MSVFGYEGRKFLRTICWTIGLYMCGKTLYQSYAKYSLFKSSMKSKTISHGLEFYVKKISVKNFLPGTTFPKLTICSKSMHSKQKLRQYYPNVTDQDLRHFYGAADSREQKNEWEKLTYSAVFSTFYSKNITFGPKIDLKTFYNRTAPEFLIYYCLLNNANCIRIPNGESLWQKDLVNIFTFFSIFHIKLFIILKC